MAWLRLTHDNGRQILLNTDQAIHIRSGTSHSGSDILSEHGMGYAHESVDEIAAMIEQAEWRERVLKCACAIMANQHSNGLTSEQVWARAARFATMEPERPAGVN